MLSFLNFCVLCSFTGRNEATSKASKGALDVHVSNPIYAAAALQVAGNAASILMPAPYPSLLSAANNEVSMTSLCAYPSTPPRSTPLEPMISVCVVDARGTEVMDAKQCKSQSAQYPQEMPAEDATYPMGAKLPTSLQWST